MGEIFLTMRLSMFEGAVAVSWSLTRTSYCYQSAELIGVPDQSAGSLPALLFDRERECCCVRQRTGSRCDRQSVGLRRSARLRCRL